MKEKNSKWFSHDSDSTNNPKIIELISREGMAGYGRWWRLLELLRDAEGYRYSLKTKFAYSAVAKELELTAEQARLFIDNCINEYELLTTDGEYLWSESLLGRMDYWESKKEILSERGKKGAAALHAKRMAEASLSSEVSMPEPCKEMANETKQNETKQNETMLVVVEEEKLTTPTPTTTITQNSFANAGINPEYDHQPLAILQQNALSNRIYFVDIICMKYNMSYDTLVQWIENFNKHLLHQNVYSKTQKDYNQHFFKWLKYQDPATTRPQDWQLYDGEREQPPAQKNSYRRRARAEPTNPPMPTARQILKEREIEYARYAKMAEEAMKNKQT